MLKAQIEFHSSCGLPVKNRASADVEPGQLGNAQSS